MPLSDKQIKFVKNIAMGMSQPQAYREAGYNPKSAGSADTLASRLLKKVEIQDALAELRAEARKKDVLDIVEKRTILAGIAKDRLMAKDSDRIRAIDVDNRMMGHYEPELHKHELEVNIVWGDSEDS